MLVIGLCPITLILGQEILKSGIQLATMRSPHWVAGLSLRDGGGARI